MRETLQEIWDSISRNKLRTFLTGFSVAWGIFMLIILLGSGNGLQNGFSSNMGDRKMNSFEIYGGRTSKAHGGFQQNRTIRIKYSDMDILQRKFPEVIDQVTAQISNWGVLINYGDQFTNVTAHGVTPEFGEIRGIKVLNGRFINQTDIAESRKVVALDEAAAKILFKNEDPIGKTINISNIKYTVVGVIKPAEFWNSSILYIPLTTGTKIYNRNSPYVHSIIITVNGIKTREQSRAFSDEILKAFAEENYFAPDDKSAVNIQSTIEQFVEEQMIFGGLSIFIWMIGIGTLIAGIMGVSNIMLVTVKERTAEIGIRKALGAKPASLIKMILVESVLITAFFGYIGMILGVGIMEMVNFFMERSAEAAALAAASADNTNPANPVIFKNPTLDLSIVFTATVVLIIAGMIAGYVPARRAARLKTIDAMRYNK